MPPNGVRKHFSPEKNRAEELPTAAKEVQKPTNLPDLGSLEEHIPYRNKIELGQTWHCFVLVGVFKRGRKRKERDLNPRSRTGTNLPSWRYKPLSHLSSNQQRLLFITKGQ